MGEVFVVPCSTKANRTAVVIIVVGFVLSVTAGYLAFSNDQSSFKSRLSAQCAERVRSCEQELQSSFAALPSFAGYFHGAQGTNSAVPIVPHSTFVADVERQGIVASWHLYSTGYGHVVPLSMMSQFMTLYRGPIQFQINSSRPLYMPITTAYQSGALGDDLMQSTSTSIVFQCLVGNCSRVESLEIPFAVGPNMGRNALVAYSPFYVNNSYGFDGVTYMPSQCPFRDTLCYQQQLDRQNNTTPLVGLVYAVYLVQQLFYAAVSSLEPAAVELQFFNPPDSSHPRYLINATVDGSGISYSDAISFALTAASTHYSVLCIPTNNYVLSSTLEWCWVAGCLTLFASVVVALVLRHHLLKLQDNEKLLAAVQVASAETDAQKRAAEEAHNKKTQFLSFVCHELRNPLNGVVGVVDWMGETELNPVQREYHNTIKMCAALMVTIVNDVLDLDKLEKKKMEFESVEYNLGDLLDSIMTSHKLVADRKNLSFWSETDSELPSVVIGDPMRLTQVLTNLLSNSFNFTKSGSVKLVVKTSDSPVPKRPDPPPTMRIFMVSFDVIDTGIGIPESSLGKLFESYTQAKVSMSREHGGSGLGLAIVHDIVAGMHGTVDVESKVGVGSRFRVVLPLLISRSQCPLDRIYSNSHFNSNSNSDSGQARAQREGVMSPMLSRTLNGQTVVTVASSPSKSRTVETKAQSKEVGPGSLGLGLTMGMRMHQLLDTPEHQRRGEDSESSGTRPFSAPVIDSNVAYSTATTNRSLSGSQTPVPSHPSSIWHSASTRFHRNVFVSPLSVSAARLAQNTLHRRSFDLSATGSPPVRFHVAAANQDKLDLISQGSPQTPERKSESAQDTVTTSRSESTPISPPEEQPRRPSRELLNAALDRLQAWSMVPEQPEQPEQPDLPEQPEQPDKRNTSDNPSSGDLDPSRPLTLDVTQGPAPRGRIRVFSGLGSAASPATTATHTGLSRPSASAQSGAAAVTVRTEASVQGSSEMITQRLMLKPREQSYFKLPITTATPSPTMSPLPSKLRSPQQSPSPVSPEQSSRLSLQRSPGAERKSLERDKGRGAKGASSHRHGSGMRAGRTHGPAYAADRQEGKQIRVLVVEVVRMLQKHGITAELASNGKQALEALGPSQTEASRFSFVLMDLEMDVMNGHEATVLIRRRGITVPIIALSGSCLDEDRERCAKEGMNGFLSKPLMAKHLEDIIRKFVTRGA